MVYQGFVNTDQEEIKGPGMDMLVKLIERARKEALKNGIEANMVAIDKSLARVIGFPMQDFDGVKQVPDMICGLQVVFDDLPVEEHAFWVFHSDKAIGDRIRRLEEENAELREKLNQVRELIEKYDV